MRNEHRNGRPGVNTQIQIKSILRQYFEDGMSAYYTSQKTGINNKTVCKYFNQWSEEIEETESVDFLERQKRERIQTIISYDSQISEARRLLIQINLEIESTIKENKKIPRHLFLQKLDLMKFISLLIEKKAAFSMTPTMDETLEKAIDEKMRKYGKTG